MNLIKLFKSKLSDESVSFYNQIRDSQVNDCKDIIEKMSEKFPELGQCFKKGKKIYIENFALTAAVVEYQREKDAINRLHNKKILIIEPDEISRFLLFSILSKFNCEIFFAENEHDTFVILRSRQIDIVLIEVHLKQTNGYDLLHKIKNLYPFIPVVVQTVCAMKHEREKCYLQGCDDFIPKPYVMESFLTTLGFCLESTHN